MLWRILKADDAQSTEWMNQNEPNRVALTVTELDHLVLTVRDIPTSINFYTSVLGMTHVTYGVNRHALRFNGRQINLHQAGREFEPRAGSPIPGSADLCFITHTPLLDAMMCVQNAGVRIVKGPVSRTGAQGELLSFYIRDPDSNLIEIANLV